VPRRCRALAIAMDDLVLLADQFGSWELLKPQDRRLFELSDYENVQQDLGLIQSQRETARTMMNMRRIHPFLEGMAHFEKLLVALDFQHTAKVMTYIWGPVRFLLKVPFYPKVLAQQRTLLTKNSMRPPMLQRAPQIEH
jgi:hypothetical protein